MKQKMNISFVAFTFLIELRGPYVMNFIPGIKIVMAKR